MRSLFIFLIYFLIGTKLWASDTLYIQHSQQKINLKHKLFFYEDTSAKLTFQAISKSSFYPKFSKLQENYYAHNIKNSAYWLALQVKNVNLKEEMHYVLTLTDVTLYLVDLYVVDNQGNIRRQQSGISISSKQKGYLGLAANFEINIPPGESYQIYIRYTAKVYVYIDVNLIPSAEFHQQLTERYIIFSFFYGFALLLLFYNLVLYVATHLRIVLYLSLFTLSLALITGSFDGFTPYFLPWLVYLSQGNYDIFTGTAVIVFLTLFMQSYLGIAQVSPIYYRFLTYYIGASISVVFLIFIKPDLAFNLLVYNGLLVLGVHLVALGLAWRTNVREVYFYAGAYFLVAINFSFSLLMLFSVLPSNWLSQYGLHFGFVGQLLMFSLGISDKINQIRLKLLLKEQENQQIIQERNQELEIKVTERTKELAIKEAKLNSVIENTDELIYALDKDYNFMVVNTATQRLFRKMYGAEVAVGKNLKEIIPPTHFEALRTTFEKTFVGEVCQFRGSVLFEGKKLYLEMFFNPIRNEKEEVSGVSVFAKDITVEEVTRVDLQYNEQLLQAVFKISPDALFLVDNDSHFITRCNQMALKLFEIADENEIVNNLGFNFYKNLLKTDEIHKITYNLQVQNAWSGEYEYSTLQGKVFWGALNISSFIVNEQVCQLARITDITEKKRAEQKLIEQEANLRIILESYDASIWMINPDYQVIAFNEGFAGFFKKMTRKDLKTYMSALDENFPAHWLSDWKNIYDQTLLGNAQTQTQTYQFKKGTQIIESKTYPIYQNNTIIGASVFSRNITQVKKFEENLKSVNNRLQGVLESTQDMVFALDTQYRYLLFNEKHAQLMKSMYGDEIEIGQSILEYMQRKDDDYKRAQQDIDRALQGQQYSITQSYGDDHIFRTYFETSYNPIRNEAYEVIGVAVFVKDVTDRKNNEQIITEKEINLRAILNNNDNSIWLVNQNCELIDYNDIFRDFCINYFEIEPYSGLNILEAVKGIDRKKWLDRYNYVFKGELGSYLDTYSFGEQEHIYSIKIFPIQQKGKITGASLFARNITRQVKAERELKENQQLIASINQHIKEGLYRSTPHKGLIYYNQAFMDMFGYSPKEIDKTDLSILYANPNERDILLEIVDRKGHANNEEILLRRKDGSIFWGLMSIIKNVDDKEAVYYDGSIRDITDVKKTERKLIQQNEALKKVNSELDKFVYSASHDLRAPLASIMGLIDITKLTQEEAERQKYYDLMLKSAKRLDDFIQQIVHYSRNARLEVHKEIIHFQELIEVSFDNLKYMPNSEKIKRNIEIEQTTDFYSDKFRLGVIFNNLISNAIRYSNPYQDEPKIEIRIQVQAESAYIQISDNGQGIDSQYLPRIFEMFYKANQQNTGSGLGLYILKETLEVLRGTIEVDSELGEGTTFSLKIPNLASINSSEVEKD